MANKLATTWKHMRRSPYQAIAAILILTLTFLAVSIFALGMLGSHQVLQYFETRPQVTAFFKDDATPESIEILKKDLEAKEFVDQVKYVSKEEALAIYREQNKQDPLLLEMVTADILPASIEVSGVTAAALPQIAQLLKEQSSVEEVVYQQDVIDTLTSWTKALRIMGLSAIGFLSVTSILLIMVMISMKIALRKHEIEVMKLIGASTWYIKGPFILEGAAYGFLGAVIGWGTTYVGLLYATPFLVSFLGNIPVLPVPVPIMLLILVTELAFGLIVGSLGSLIAVRRFLR